MPHLCNSCCGYCYRFQRHTVTTTGSCAMASFYFPALRYVFLRLDSPAYQKCQPTPWHFEMKTAKSLAFITSVRAAITKRKKKKKRNSVRPYHTFLCTACDGTGGKKMYLVSPVLITASVAAKLYCGAKTIPRLVPDVRVCVRRRYPGETK